MKAFYILFCLGFVASINAATFTSTGVTTGFATSTSWSVTGIDTDGIPDNNDDLIIQSGHTISLITGDNFCKSITISNGGLINCGTAKFLKVYGNFSNSGTVSGTLFLYFYNTTLNFSSSSALSLGILSINTATVTVVAGTTLNSATTITHQIRSNSRLTNNGTITTGNFSTQGSSGNSLINNAGGSITINSNFPFSNLTITNNNNSSFTYNSGVTSIYNTTYHNLTLAGSGSTKTASAAFNVNGNLTINNGVTLNLATNTLNLKGHLTNNGTISNLGSDVNLTGTTAQNIASAQSLAFTNLTSSNAAGASITSGTHTISNSLTVSSGNLNVGSNILTLLSDATKTAYIGNGAGSISGSMIIQRYLPARTASYTDLTSPVTSTTIDDWDDELYMAISATNNVAGYPGGDGMNPPPNEFFSVTEYNTATNWYDSIVTGHVLEVGRGYGVWIADDATSFPGRAIDSRGTPNMGTPTYNAVYDAGNTSFPGWNLIGNPHAAFIDWDDVVAASSNVNTNIQIYDGSGNYEDNFLGPEIAPGQGFWCEVTASTTINFPQSAKRTTTSSAFLRGTKNINHDLKLRLSSGANPYYHEIKINFDNTASLSYEKGSDIPFIKSPKQTAPSITFVDGTHKFIRNRMNTSSSLVVLPLEINTPIAGNYTIELEGLLSNGIYSEAYLINNTTKEQLEIGDASSVNVYFEKGETNNNYSLVLKKANVPLNLTEDNVSIFSTADFINVKGSFETAQTVKIEVYNIVGQLVMNTTAELLPNDRITLATADLQSEVYVVKVTTSNNQQFTDKIVVTK